MLARSAVQRHTAASRSTRPLMRLVAARKGLWGPNHNAHEIQHIGANTQLCGVNGASSGGNIGGANHEEEKEVEAEEKGSGCTSLIGSHFFTKRYSTLKFLNHFCEFCLGVGEVGPDCERIYRWMGCVRVCFLFNYELCFTVLFCDEWGFIILCFTFKYITSKLMEGQSLSNFFNRLIFIHY